MKNNPFNSNLVFASLIVVGPKDMAITNFCKKATDKPILFSYGGTRVYNSWCVLKKTTATQLKVKMVFLSFRMIGRAKEGPTN